MASAVVVDSLRVPYKTHAASKTALPTGGGPLGQPRFFPALLSHAHPSYRWHLLLCRQVTTMLCMSFLCTRRRHVKSPCCAKLVWISFDIETPRPSALTSLTARCTPCSDVLAHVRACT